MKFGTLTMLFTNTMGLLVGLTMYFLMVGDFVLAFYFGLTSAILGNAYGLYVKHNLKRIIWDFVNEMMKPSEEEKEEVLNILEAMKE